MGLNEDESQQCSKGENTHIGEDLLVLADLAAASHKKKKIVLWADGGGVNLSSKG